MCDEKRSKKVSLDVEQENGQILSDENSVVLSANPSSNLINELDNNKSSKLTKIISLIAKNSCLFKSHLLLKLIQSNKNGDHDVLENILADKILLKIVELFLDSSSNHYEIECHEINLDEFSSEYTRLFRYLYCQFSRLTEKKYVINDENEIELKELIKDLSESVKIKIDNMNRRVDSDSKLNQNNDQDKMRKSFFSGIIQKLQFCFVNKSTENVVSDYDFEKYESIFDERIRIRLEALVLNIIEKLLIMTQNELRHKRFTKGNSEQFNNTIFELSSLVRLYKNNSTAFLEPKSLVSNHKRKLKHSKSHTDVNMNISEFSEPQSSSSSINLDSKRTKRVNNRLSSSFNASDKNGSFSEKNCTLKSESNSLFTSENEARSADSTSSMSEKDETDLEKDRENDDADYDESEDEENLLFKNSKMKSKKSSGREWWNKFSPLTISVLKLPGIGGTYAKRLKDRKMEKLGDLVNFYEVKCNSNVRMFRNELKETFNMRQDSVNKLTSIVENYLRNKESNQ
jgi:hypothetical protein